MRNVDKEAREEARNARIGAFVAAWGEGPGVGDLSGGRLREVRIRLPTEEDPTTLVVVRAFSEEGPRVTFIGAYSPGDALLAWRARVRAGSVKWREDVPWEDR